jgi:hypothetical protein
MIQQEQIDRVLELLEAILKRPLMYFGKADDVEIANSFISGFSISLFHTFDIPFSRVDVLGESVTKRGHRFSPRGIWQELKEEGLDNEQIINELIQIQIEMWRIIKNRLEEQVEQSISEFG